MNHLKMARGKSRDSFDTNSQDAIFVENESQRRRIRTPRGEDHPMKFALPTTVAAFAATAMLGVAAHASPIDPNLSGNTSYDGWAGMTDANYDQSDYGGDWPGGPWNETIVANQAGSGDASLAKVAGVGYLASDGIYVAGAAPLPNTFGGTFSVFDTTPLANVNNVVFQIDISNAYGGFDFYDNAFPTLIYTTAEGDTALEISLSGIVFKGEGPVDPISGGKFDRHTYLFQWDLSDLATLEDPISALRIDFSTVQHTFIYALRLDQSDQFVAVDNGLFIPEPASLTLLAAAGGFLMMRRQQMN